MPLYSSFSISDYYDNDKKPTSNTMSYCPFKAKKPPLGKGTPKYASKTDYGVNSFKDKKQPKQEQSIAKKPQSLYKEAQEIASKKSEYDHIDFRDLYREGQMVMIQAMNGRVRTKKGRIVEIVNRDLMYVAMEDSYKDVNGFYLIDFVTSSDIITRL